jgi:peptide deformylase
MILPVFAYGEPILKQKALEIEPSFEGLEDFINNMFETMYHAGGVGLAAPQIGQSLRVFVVDAEPFAEDEEPNTHYLRSFKKVFINPIIKKETGEEWAFREGCLSIPGIREDVYRHEKVTIQYYDQNFNELTETFTDFAARIVQHEYDHLEGKLFVEKISPLRRQMIKRKLEEIKGGQVDVNYRMKFPKK